MQYAYQLDNQDWTPVVFRKKRTVDKSLQKARSELEPSYKRGLNENGESFEVKYFDKDYVKDVIGKRIQKNWTQKELANATNLDISVIQRLEQGKLVYDGNLKNKLNTVLGIKRSP